MGKFSKETAQKILANEIVVEDLLALYPEYKEGVLQEIALLKQEQGGNIAQAMLDKYTANAQLAKDKIVKSAFNIKTLDAFLPLIIKARFALYLLQQANITASGRGSSQKARLGLWDGAILQRLLFKKGSERKPARLALFRLFWPLVRDKKLLMPLLNKKGIYCFYTQELIARLARLLAGKKCLEIAAGDGTLARFLTEAGIDCHATDDYSWDYYIEYPSFVEKLDARAALKKYAPEIVICSWPAPGNSFEKHVFQTDSVSLYIVIGTKSPVYSGDFSSYHNARNFSMELDGEMSALVLPPSAENAVYIFQRK